MADANGALNTEQAENPPTPYEALNAALQNATTVNTAYQKDPGLANEEKVKLAQQKLTEAQEAFTASTAAATEAQNAGMNAVNDQIAANTAAQDPGMVGGVDEQPKQPITFRWPDPSTQNQGPAVAKETNQQPTQPPVATPTKPFGTNTVLADSAPSPDYIGLQPAAQQPAGTNTVLAPAGTNSVLKPAEEPAPAITVVPPVPPVGTNTVLKPADAPPRPTNSEERKDPFGTPLVQTTLPPNNNLVLNEPARPTNSEEKKDPFGNPVVQTTIPPDRNNVLVNEKTPLLEVPTPKPEPKKQELVQQDPEDLLKKEPTVGPETLHLPAADTPKVEPLAKSEPAAAKGDPKTIKTLDDIATKKDTLSKNQNYSPEVEEAQNALVASGAAAWAEPTEYNSFTKDKNGIARNASGVVVLNKADKGIFGPSTEQATKDFQVAANLTPDGQLGRATAVGLKETLNSGQELIVGSNPDGSPLVNTEVKQQVTKGIYKDLLADGLTDREKKSLSETGKQEVLSQNAAPEAPAATPPGKPPLAEKVGQMLG